MVMTIFCAEHIYTTMFSWSTIAPIGILIALAIVGFIIYYFASGGKIPALSYETSTDVEVGEQK